MISTMILPLIILIVLSLRIYQGLIKVRKNLNRHKSLEKKNANEKNMKTIGCAGKKHVSPKVKNIIKKDEVAEGMNSFFKVVICMSNY